MIWLLILLGATICIWWMSGYGHRKKLKQIAKELPTSIPALPLIGHTHMFIGTAEDRMNGLQRLARDALQQGGTIAYWNGYYLYLAVSDPVVADLLLKNCLSKDEKIIHCLHPYTGNGSLGAPVPIWRPRRKVLSPSFSPKNLNAFVEIFAKQSATMVELLRPKVGAADFSIWKYLDTYTFDSVLETNLGVKINSQKNVYHPFLEAFDNTAAYIATRMVQPWLYSDFIYRMMPSYKQLKRCVSYIDKFVNEIIQENEKNLRGFSEKKSTDASEPKVRTILDTIMEAPVQERKLNNEELLEEMKVIVTAGTDTSAIGACNTLLMLARHPEIQEAVHKELLEVFGDSDREVAVEDLQHLKYLEMVIKESFRLYPPAPAVVRETTSDITLPNGTTLPKGIGIIVMIWGVHRNQQYWGEDADSFRPERFLEPLKHPAQFIPFSWGMRNCLGYKYAMMSQKTVIATFLRSYQVLPPSNLDPSQYKDPLRVKFDMTMRDVDNFIVRLKKRT